MRKSELAYGLALALIGLMYPLLCVFVIVVRRCFHATLKIFTGARKNEKTTPVHTTSGRDSKTPAGLIDRTKACVSQLIVGAFARSGGARDSRGR